jgi:hypothetical protein
VVLNERVDDLEVVGPGVGTESARDVRRGGAPQPRRFGQIASKRATEDESGRERVAASGGVDDVHRIRRHRDGLLRGDDEGTIAASGYGHASGSGAQQRSSTRLQVGGAGEAQHLLIIGQQVVDVR